MEGSILLLGIEERELRLDDDLLTLTQTTNHKYAVRRVLINPGRRYRLTVQPPMMEVKRVWVFWGGGGGWFIRVYVGGGGGPFGWLE
jgi:hypothetical protein